MNRTTTHMMRCDAPVVPAAADLRIIGHEFIIDLTAREHADACRRQGMRAWVHASTVAVVVETAEDEIAVYETAARHGGIAAGY